MNRVLDKKAAARAMAAPAPVKKKKLVNTIAHSKPSTAAEYGTTPASKKRKAATASEDGEDSDDSAPEHDLDFLSLLSPSLATKKKAKKSQSATEDSLESSVVTTKSTKSTKPAASKPRTGPEVVVFDASKVGGGKGSASAGGMDFSFKKFMSSKISKLDEAPPPIENPLTAEEKEEELQNKRNDAELHSLIKASRLLEQYNADQLDGVERRRHQRDQLVSLGIQKKEKIRVPLQIGLGMMAKKRERDLKELEEAKNNGMYHKSIKHTFAAAGGKKKERPRSERGLKTSMGRFKNGMLTLTEKEIKSVQREGVKKKASGKKSGGGGGKGGKGGKKKGKGRH
ncbi:hypothetical protein BGZ80_008232 [Entomortierella chlamydospora]|uniref:Uncharacterized protein n=1 Tax=Entomortierella chlamydospora TaxID=101097 RepID=A0A9P6MXF4_9FUNG|nr:hypothetical protein BGZ79_005569 [Entomortierella chlamydospora]KAG0017484.1 hypothetical protein BGZ80_008232 [Entomortierella chlamydospora]